MNGLMLPMYQREAALDAPYPPGTSGEARRAPDTVQGLMQQYLTPYLPQATVKGLSTIAGLTGVGGTADLLMKQHQGAPDQQPSAYEWPLMAADWLPGAGKGLGLAMAAIPAPHAASKMVGARAAMSTVSDSEPGRMPGLMQNDDVSLNDTGLMSLYDDPKAYNKDRLAAEAAAKAEPSKPLFDYSNMQPATVYPNDPYFSAPYRSKGLPQWIAEQMGEGAAKRVNAAAQRGIDAFESGKLIDDPRQWYHMGQLQDAFRTELGKVDGDAALISLLDHVGSTTAKSPPMQNFRRATYFDWMKSQGADTAEIPPSPYGSMTQNTHKSATQRLWDTGTLDHSKNPKPAHFSQNLGGNQEVSTIDEVMSGTGLLNVTSQSGKLLGRPHEGAYGHWRDFQSGLAQRFGLKPDEYQASAWVGSQDDKRIVQYSKSALRIFEERIKATSKLLREDPKTTMKRWINKEIPLIGAAGATLLTGAQIPEEGT